MSQVFDDLVQQVEEAQAAIDDHETRLQPIEDQFEQGLQAQLQFPLDPNTVQLIQGLFPIGTAVLSGGTATVADLRISGSSTVLFSVQSISGPAGHIQI